MRTPIVAACIASLVWFSAVSARPSSHGAESAPATFIQSFFALIDAHRVGEAVALLGPQAAPNASARAAWRQQFSAIDAIRVRDIRPSNIEAGPCPAFRVALDVRMVAGAGRAPIPNYGWGRNPNLRWVTVCRTGPGWRIAAIATGP